MTRRDGPAVRRRRGWSSARRGDPTPSAPPPPPSPDVASRPAPADGVAAGRRVLARVLRILGVVAVAVVAVPILLFAAIVWITADVDIAFVTEEPFPASLTGYASATGPNGGCSVRVYDIDGDVGARIAAGVHGGFAAPERYGPEWRPGVWEPARLRPPSTLPWSTESCSAERADEAAALAAERGARVATLTSVGRDRMALLILSTARGALLVAEFGRTDATLADATARR